ncbi:MAG: hypothetical protein QOF78_2079 [Phycisphaerales bacterium]|jgi:hypothetical protein|nr:hypothetical protein [Phycisphaerales bacterium]MEA2736547.1 hypothetical protein [Humisphaera sp.]
MSGMKSIAYLMLIFVLAGCGAGKSYQVEVKNQTNGPVTLWLTKDGPPKEDGWYSPEEIDAMPENARPAYDLAIVPPGKTGFTGKVAGEFPKGTAAVLRVYEGSKELFHIVEDAKAGRQNRSDHVLKPGMNRLSVVEHSGRLVVEPSK